MSSIHQNDHKLAQPKLSTASQTQASNLQAQSRQIQSSKAPNKYVPDFNMTLYIKTLTGKSFNVILPKTSTVLQLKTSIQKVEGIPENQQKLVTNGKLLEDNQILQNINFGRESLIYLVLRLRGDVGHFIAHQQSQSHIAENCCQNQKQQKLAFSLSGYQHLLGRNWKNYTQADYEGIVRKLRGDNKAQFKTYQINLPDQICKKMIKLADQAYENSRNLNVQQQITQDLKLILSQQELLSLIGSQIYQKLKFLFSSFSSENNQNSQPVILLRRCSAPSKHLPLHLDTNSSKTLQLALNSQQDFEGGKLIYVTKSAFHEIERKKGTVTIHDQTIAHGVTAIKGVRYSLFFLQK